MKVLLDRASLAALDRSHGSMVLRRARSVLQDEAAAEDVLQEPFPSFVARPERFAGESSASSMFYAMTTHHCLQRLRT